MTKNLMIILLLLLLTLSIQAWVDEINKIKGGYKKCDSYSFDYKFGEVDLKTKRIIETCKYNERGYLIGKYYFY